MREPGMCVSGKEVPLKGKCPHCGAYNFQPCGLLLEKQAKARAKQIADRAEQRGHSS